MAYSAKDITVLKGLEPVRERPGMYIGSTGLTGLHHLVYEVVDNAVDEAMAGEATRIDVVLLADGGCRVTDNGRGIPVDNHPEYRGKSAAEVVMTVLHAGGKFGGDGYKISGGLHGVGVSVVNALSVRLELEIHRDGGKWVQSYAKGGVPQGKIQRVAASKKRGTTVTFWPDPLVFEETEFRAQTLIERLREMAFLNKSLEIRFRDERTDPGHGAGLQVQRRHRRLRAPPQHLEGAAVQAGGRRSRSRAPSPKSTSRCSGTPATTRGSTRSRTTSPPPRAGCTRRASRRPSPTWSTSTPRARTSSRTRTTTSSGRTSGKASPRSSR